MKALVIMLVTFSVQAQIADQLSSGDSKCEKPGYNSLNEALQWIKEKESISYTNVFLDFLDNCMAKTIKLEKLSLPQLAKILDGRFKQLHKMAAIVGPGGGNLKDLHPLLQIYLAKYNVKEQTKDVDLDKIKELLKVKTTPGKVGEYYRKYYEVEVKRYELERLMARKVNPWLLKKVYYNFVPLVLEVINLRDGTKISYEERLATPNRQEPDQVKVVNICPPEQPGCKRYVSHGVTVLDGKTKFKNGSIIFSPISLILTKGHDIFFEDIAIDTLWIDTSAPHTPHSVLIGTDLRGEIPEIKRTYGHDYWKGHRTRYNTWKVINRGKRPGKNTSGLAGKDAGKVHFLSGEVEGLNLLVGIGGDGQSGLPGVPSPLAKSGKYTPFIGKEGTQIEVVNKITYAFIQWVDGHAAIRDKEFHVGCGDAGDGGNGGNGGRVLYYGPNKETQMEKQFTHILMSGRPGYGGESAPANLCPPKQNLRSTEGKNGKEDNDEKLIIK